MIHQAYEPYIKALEMQNKMIQDLTKQLDKIIDHINIDKDGDGFITKESLQELKDSGILK